MRPSFRRWGRLSSRSLFIFAIAVAVLVILRVLLPIGIKYGINWGLENKVPGYHGSIEDFDLSLLRGRYWIEGFVLQKSEAPDLPPFVHIGEMEVSLSWKGLFRGRLLTKINLRDAQVYFIDSRKDENKAQLAKEDFDWRELYWNLVPFQLEELNLTQSEIYFANLDLGLKEKLFFSNLRLHVRNIQNLDRDQARLPTPFFVSGRLQGKAIMQAEGRLNFLRSPIEIDGDVSVIDFELPDINPVLLSYLPLSFQKGKVSLFAEIATRERQVTGYVKPFIDEVKVTGNRSDFMSLPHFGIEMLTAMANLIFRDGEKTIATKVEFTGSFDEPEIRTGRAIWGALENAYTGKTLERKIEESVSQKNLITDN